MLQKSWVWFSFVRESIVNQHEEHRHYFCAHGIQFELTNSTETMKS